MKGYGQAKDICCLLSGAEIQILLPTASWHWSLHGKQHPAPDGTALYSPEKRQSKISSNSWCQCPRAKGFLQAPTQGSWPALTAPVLWQKDSISSPQWTDVILGLARCHLTHMLKQGKGVHIQSETGEVIPKGINPAQAMGTLYLLVRKCSGTKAHSYVAQLELTDDMHETVFLNIMSSLWN